MATIHHQPDKVLIRLSTKLLFFLVQRKPNRQDTPFIGDKNLMSCRFSPKPTHWWTTLIFEISFKSLSLKTKKSQSFSQSYGSVLPTSLTYFALSTRGYKPWRPDAAMGTTRGVNNLSFGFSRAVENAPDTLFCGVRVLPFFRHQIWTTQYNRILKVDTFPPYPFNCFNSTAH